MDDGQDEEEGSGVCAGGLGRFAADSSCFPTRLEKGGKMRIGREEQSGSQDQYAARSRSKTRRPKTTTRSNALERSSLEGDSCAAARNTPRSGAEKINKLE
jgi:hypothetical protein